MRLFFAIIIALSSAFTFRSGAEFYFLEKNHDFPDAHEGTVLTYAYTFRNIGDEPLIISDYKVACSCTKISFPKEPVLPGQEGKINLRFDTRGKYGFQSRKIQIIANTRRIAKLSFRVFVVRENPPEEE